MQEKQLEIETADGVMDTFVCHPDEGGPHPAIVMYKDAPGMREELRDMARRLGTAGYYVALPNLYYRVGREGGFGFDRERIRVDDAERDKMFAVMRSLSNAGVVADTGPLLAAIRADAAAADGPLGCVGYCMSGQFVMAVGAAYPDDFAAIASYYGVGIITEAEDSPHRDAAKIKGEVYLAFAEDDPYVPPALLERMGPMLEEAGVRHRVEIYPGTEHGFAFAEREAVYVKPAGERHWERMFDLYRRTLAA